MTTHRDLAAAATAHRRRLARALVHQDPDGEGATTLRPLLWGAVAAVLLVAAVVLARVTGWPLPTWAAPDPGQTVSATFSSRAGAPAPR